MEAHESRGDQEVLVGVTLGDTKCEPIAWLGMESSSAPNLRAGTGVGAHRRGWEGE